MSSEKISVKLHEQDGDNFVKNLVTAVVLVPVDDREIKVRFKFNRVFVDDNECLARIFHYHINKAIKNHNQQQNQLDNE